MIEVLQRTQVYTLHAYISLTQVSKNWDFFKSSIYNFLNVQFFVQFLKYLQVFFFYPSQLCAAFWSREDHSSSMPHSWAAGTMNTLSLF